MLTRGCFLVPGLKFNPIPSFSNFIGQGQNMHIASAGRLVRGAAVFQGLLCFYGCSTTSPDANADRQGDPQLAARVKDAMSRDQRVYAAQINVTAEHGGVVHLSGMVASADDLNQAKHTAQSVADVRAVVEDLQIADNAGRR
jgi:osmotically-inducible protein OsmY